MTLRRTRSAILRISPLVMAACLLVLHAGRAAQWQQESATDKSLTPRPQAARGKTVFDQRCEICHFPESTAQKIGPGLKGLYARGKFADGKKVDDAAVIKWIESGGKDMPGFKGIVTPEQIRDLVAYLRTL